MHVHRRAECIRHGRRLLLSHCVGRVFAGARERGVAGPAVHERHDAGAVVWRPEAARTCCTLQRRQSLQLPRRSRLVILNPNPHLSIAFWCFSQVSMQERLLEDKRLPCLALTSNYRSEPQLLTLASTLFYNKLVQVDELSNPNPSPTSERVDARQLHETTNLCLKLLLPCDLRPPIPPSS